MTRGSDGAGPADSPRLLAIRPVVGSEPGDQDRPAETLPLELGRILIVAVAAAVVWLRIWEPFPRVSIIGLLATVLGGWPIFREAWDSLLERRMTMELSMTIALVAALIIGESVTALIITAFVLAAEVLERLTVGRGRRAIRDLLDYLPATATVRRSGGTVRLPLDQLEVGDIVVVAPGERIAADGAVRSGDSYVDQATITGESKPAHKTAGGSVFAGTVNQSGALEIVAERIGRDTSFGKIVEAIETAEQSRAPVQKTTDRYAGYLVYFALACAAVTFLMTRNVRSTISVIIVAGACGIAAGTPLAVLGAIGRAAREGAIVKGGRFLESLWRVDTMIFDKTGTLTIGMPEVREILPAPSVHQRALLAAAAIAERRSEHPFAKAIVRRADALDLPAEEPDEFEYTPGRGVLARCAGDPILVGSRPFLSEHGITTIAPDELQTSASTSTSTIYVARGGAFLGSIRIADSARPEAANAVHALEEMGIRTMLVSGDSEVVARSLALDLGIQQVRGGLLPHEKADLVGRMMREGGNVAMVGDGVNDAPALVVATVGVAMGSGTDVARESADIVLLGSDLSKLVETTRIARRARGIIRFNFVGTIAVDLIGVGLAAWGLLSPLLAVFIHVLSELTFILNSARLLPALSSKRGRSDPREEGFSPDSRNPLG